MNTLRTPPLCSPVRLNRRRLLASAVALPWLGLSTTLRAQEPALKICQSTALSGPLGDLGSALHLGAKAAFASINAKGGIHGRQIVLQTLDDGYEVPRAMANLNTFLADRDCFALYNCFGTPMVGAMLPKVQETGIPFFAPYTGAQVCRIPGARNIFNVRASYAEEAEKAVQHLATIGIRRIAVVYQNNSFGKEVFAGAQLAMEQAKLPGAITATVENDASDAGTAARKLGDSNPEAVLIGLAGKPALEFVKAFRALRQGVSLYALSVLGTSANVKALGANGTGMAISQVVPLPTNVITPVVRDFQQALKALETPVEPSHLALEGYINARVFMDALQRAGKNPTRGAFIDATWALKKIDLGGFEIHATVPERNASRFVELTMVGRDGRFLR